MSFTPGPNTVMAMISGQQRGVRSSLNLNWGMLFGVAIIGAIAALFANGLKNTPNFITSMKILGSVYLAYLTYHVFISSPTYSDDKIGNFFTGFFLPLTNIKIYLYFITGLSAFTLGGVFSSILFRWLIMVVVAGTGTFAWTILGANNQAGLSEALSSC